MPIHELKCHPDYFGEVMEGTKTFEVRLNDRGFSPGDYLYLREFTEDWGYTFDECMARVTYVLHGPCAEHGDALHGKAASGVRLRDDEESCGCHAHEPFLGVAPGYVVLGIKVLSRD